MRGADVGNRRLRDRPRRLPLAAVIVAAFALSAAGLWHLTHDHPHPPGQELSCAVCQSPLGEAPAAPELAPPVVQVATPPPRVVATPTVGRAPLSFSPKQSPPASA